MNDDITNAKSSIADKIHAAVTTLLDNEMRLNAELVSAHNTIRQQEEELRRLQDQLTKEQEVRRNLEQIISKIAELAHPEH